MYHLEGESAILRNAVVLSRPYLHADVPVSQESLRTGYLRYLRSLAEPDSYADYLDHRIKQESAGDGSEMLFSGDQPEIDILGAIFGNPDPGGDARLGAAPTWRLEKCRAGGRFLAERDAKLAAVTTLLTHTVFSVSTSWTGSMSDRRAIGATLLIPGEHWHDNDVAEAFVHEFTHTALFLDERVHGHFQPGADQIALNSAIRKDERTLPAVVHSLLVAVEILSWRHNHGLWEGIPFLLHGSSQNVLGRAGESYRALVGLPSWRGAVKDRMAELVEEAGRRLKAF